MKTQNGQDLKKLWKLYVKNTLGPTVSVLNRGGVFIEGKQRSYEIKRFIDFVDESVPSESERRS